MRRTDREITDPEKIREIIDDCTCCRLGLCDEGKAYIVPLSFGYTEREGRYVFYFHSAREGRKLDLIRRTGWAAETDPGLLLPRRGVPPTVSGKAPHGILPHRAGQDRRSGPVSLRVPTL